jgi:hypothetical protein
MANQKYRVSGGILTNYVGARLNDLLVVAYKFHSLSSMQTFATSPVDASGNFELTFDYGAVGSGPIDIDLMPILKDIERFGVFNIERSAPGVFFPKKHISTTDWVLTQGVYTVKVMINITEHIWRRWNWLSQEFTIIGKVVKKEGDTHLPIPRAMVWTADVDLPKPYGSGVGGAETDESGRFNLIFKRINFFLDYANYIPTTKRYGTETWPDLIFHVVQMIGGIKTVIYEETESDARPQSMWDIPNRILYVTLVTDKGVTNDEQYLPIPAGDNFLFHGIGLVDPHSIVDGYATTGPMDDLPNRKDSPFGSTLVIKGQFDVTIPKPPKYYHVLYKKWNDSTPPSLGDFTPILNESWSVSKFNTSTGSWEPLVIEPLSGIVLGEKVYEIPDYMDITQTKKTRLISWRSQRIDAGVQRYPDGKYDILVKAWDSSGNPINLNPAHPERNRLTVVIDNKWPKALLKRIGTHDILRTDEMHPYTPVCPVFSKAVGNMQVVFDAFDENNHFLRYRLSFITGHNFYVDEFVKRYDGKFGSNERFDVIKHHKAIGTGIVTTIHLPDSIIPPGGFHDESVNWNIGHPDVVKCAYQVRLRVWDRTINGYGYIHTAVDTMHFSIEP